MVNGQDWHGYIQASDLRKEINSFMSCITWYTIFSFHMCTCINSMQLTHTITVSVHVCFFCLGKYGMHWTMNKTKRYLMATGEVAEGSFLRSRCLAPSRSLCVCKTPETCLSLSFSHDRTLLLTNAMHFAIIAAQQETAILHFSLSFKLSGLMIIFGSSRATDRHGLYSTGVRFEVFTVN
jgi:hypothetical protein